VDDSRRIASDRLSAVITRRGAELVSLKDFGGDELLWQAGPEWPRHAPLLFPVVGKLTDDALRHDGKTCRVTQHGFARDLDFEWVERSEARAVLALVDDEATRELYPFAFRLEMDFSVDGSTLSVISRVSNPSADILPFSIGAHPGFRWPLLDGVPKERHILEFETAETGKRRAVEGGLLGPEAPLPFDGKRLALDPKLFVSDALVMPDVASKSVRYSALSDDGRPLRSMTVSWRGYEDLGVWSAPKGGPFLCIEPWRGMASFVGWDGPFMEKPGVVKLAPGETMDFEWRVEI
jgi:galactose mutarotase-like enzyme